MSTPAELLKRKFRAAWPHLDERTRRIMAATEAMSLGFGGVSVVSRACGLSRKAIHKGIHELEEGEPLVGRIRRPGAGRKAITVSGSLRPDGEEQLTSASRPCGRRFSGDDTGVGALGSIRDWGRYLPYPGAMRNGHRPG